MKQDFFDIPFIVGVVIGVFILLSVMSLYTFISEPTLEVSQVGQYVCEKENGKLYKNYEFINNKYYQSIKIYCQDNTESMILINFKK